MRTRRARVYPRRPVVWWTSADLTRARVDFAYFARRVIVHRAGRPNNTLGGLHASTLARIEEENRAAREAGEAEPYGFLEMAMTSGVRAGDLIIDDTEVSPADVERFKRETWDPLVRKLMERRKAP